LDVTISGPKIFRGTPIPVKHTNIVIYYGKLRHDFIESTPLSEEYVIA
jgi:hypothetical protein